MNHSKMKILNFFIFKLVVYIPLVALILYKSRSNNFGRLIQYLYAMYGVVC